MDLRTAYTWRLEQSSRRQQRLAALLAFSVSAGMATLLLPELLGARVDGGINTSSSLVHARAPVLGSTSVAQRKRIVQSDPGVAQLSVAANGPGEAELDAEIGGVTDQVDGGFMVASAAGVGVENDSAVSGQRFQTMSFPNGAGLLLSAAAPFAGTRPAMPSVSRADRSGLYHQGLVGRSSGSPDAGAAAGEAATTPADGAGDPTSGRADPVTSGGNNGGSGDPANGANNGNGGTGAGDSSPAPTTPNPQTGPGLPQDGSAPSSPTSPLPLPQAPGDVGLPTAPTAPTEVPEPGTMWLSAAAASALLWMRRRKK